MNKKLGKGLQALIKSYETDKPDLLNQGIPVDKIIPNKNQPRQIFNDSDMENLVQSITKHGVLQPISVRKIDNQYELIAGERRFKAAKKAKLKKIPAYVLSVGSESEMMEYALIENIQRVDLNPIEEAEGYAILSGKYKFTHAKLERLIACFCECDGEAIEIISGRQSLAQTDKLRQLAHKFSLLASVGSDFHCDGRYLADIGIN